MISPDASLSSHTSGRGAVDIIVGSQWGDEGKGKLVDIISGKYEICARVAGGSNAGHTIVVDVSYFPDLSANLSLFRLFYTISRV